MEFSFVFLLSTLNLHFRVCDREDILFGSYDCNPLHAFTVE